MSFMKVCDLDRSMGSINFPGRDQLDCCPAIFVDTTQFPPEPSSFSRFGRREKLLFPVSLERRTRPRKACNHLDREPDDLEL
jgi:hypothetical protein